VWGWLKDAARAVWDGLWGVASSLFGILKWAAQRGAGFLEFITSYFGFMPEKKLRVHVVILPDTNRKPIGSRAEVQAVLDLAREVFKDEANVKIQSHAGSDNLMISNFPGPVPPEVLEPKCDVGGWLQVFNSVGRWFRENSARTPAGVGLGYGAPATIFVVANVQGKRGCWPSPFSDYGFIDPDYLGQSQEGLRLGFAHELAHSCDLVHQDNGSLMESGWTRRRAHLTRFERAWLRSSPRVTYL
jgi:hypothetical protein